MKIRSNSKLVLAKDLLLRFAGQRGHVLLEGAELEGLLVGEEADGRQEVRVSHLGAVFRRGQNEITRSLERYQNTGASQSIKIR